jgi:hypothetical protein
MPLVYGVGFTFAVKQAKACALNLNWGANHTSMFGFTVSGFSLGDLLLKAAATSFTGIFDHLSINRVSRCQRSSIPFSHHCLVARLTL